MADLKMELVVLETPYAGDVSANVAYARACMQDCLLRGEAPIASHLLYTQPGVLDDNVPAERSLGMTAGWAWMSVSTKVVAYTDRGLSSGMQAGISQARAVGIPIEFRKLDPDRLAKAHYDEDALFDRAQEEMAKAASDAEIPFRGEIT